MSCNHIKLQCLGSTDSMAKPFTHFVHTNCLSLITNMGGTLQIFIHSTQAFTLQYGANPASPSSLPIPLCFTPPNGILKSESLLLLIHTIPASISLATLCALFKSLVKIADPSP
ncbi:uncharacterized protein QC764_0112870 [Podospora pseudoanserina]|uniref:Uncharacterized protein n=1 Tax=Podospora pseudoanserina TaxID=2609844 RepID=A0ABR0HJQ9_9PEZI|nr:hypothetical protein QC764_0112870 [Podospora pseudoanserina]